MGFETPFLPENQPDTLYEFGFYKVQRQTKASIVNMLRNFFDSMNNVYKTQMPEIRIVDNSAEAERIAVDQSFPSWERKIPIILVGIKNATERKLYIGADNLSKIEIIETSTGSKKAVNVYTGAADISLVLIVVATTPENRMRFAELVAMCFTHYYRWQYFYTIGDGNMFSICPNTTQLEFGTESEATDVSPTNLLYITDISMKCYVEYTFRDTAMINTVMGDLTVILDENSGPLELD